VREQPWFEGASFKLPLIVLVAELRMVFDDHGAKVKKIVDRFTFMIQQVEITLEQYPRGFHLITSDIVSQLDISDIDAGMLHVFIKHTSASLTINENADPTVRMDFESHFNKYIPENAPYYRHDYEGSDDMPAHLKSSTLGSSVLIPITKGQLNLGTWQGIYLGEHRDYGGRRKLVVTVYS